MVKTKDPALEARRRAQVIATAQRLMTESSCAAMTMDVVARAAGVSKGLINYYFKSKDELIIAAIRAYHAKETASLLAIASAPDVPVRERLRGVIEAVFPNRTAVQAEQRFQIEIRAYAKTRPEVFADVGDSYRSFRVACEALLRHGIDGGLTNRKMSDDDVRWTYLFFHSTINGLGFQVALDPSIDLADLRERVFQHLVKMVT